MVVMMMMSLRLGRSSSWQMVRGGGRTTRTVVSKAGREKQWYRGGSGGRRDYYRGGSRQREDGTERREGAVAVMAATTGTATLLEGETPPRPYWGGVIDKESTGAEALRREVGGADGSGVTIAVLDTGVDPAAPGLEKTPSGEVKVIDCIDATGAGDVDTSKRVEAKDGFVTGLTGRKLPADASKWTVDGKFLTQPTEFRVGAKRTADLWPRSVRDRRAREKARRVDAQHGEWLAEARANLERLKAAEPKATNAKTPALAEAEAVLAELERAKKELAPTAASVAPVVDVLVWRDPDADILRGVVFADDEDDDTLNVRVLSDMAEATARGERTSRFARFGDSDLLTYSLSFYADGDVTTLVAPSGDHGTHVAGIAAAYDERSDELCGVAPGAKIISIKIGDARLGTMETSTALARAAVAAKKKGADLINLSYGEAASLCDAGAFADKATKLVHEGKGLLFVSSAGNNGPALSTVGAPGSTTSALLGVGAYVTPEMRRDLYSTRPQAVAKTKGLMYSFSSRGPATDGGLGVSIAAPGGAVASIPKYALQPKRLMHGTSMASPNACGALACLLSALKGIDGQPKFGGGENNNNNEWAPAVVRRLVESTAATDPGGDVLSTGDAGRGVIDVRKAYLAASRVGKAERDVRYHVQVPERAAGSGAPPARGVYLREAFEIARKCDVSVAVKPRFQDDRNVPAWRKADFAKNVRLESDQDWVQCGTNVVLTYAGKAVPITVDPSGLGADAVHYATVRGFDADDPEAPALFDVPITVVKPRPGAEVKPVALDHAPVGPGSVKRVFLTPPPDARSATLSLELGGSSVSNTDKGGGDDVVREATTKRLIHVATVQLLPQGAYSALHLHKRVWMAPGDKVTFELADVAPGKTMEVCVSQDWNSVEESELSCGLEFKADGLSPEGLDSVVLRGTRSVAVVDLGCPDDATMASTIASPQAKFKKWRRPLRPIGATVAPCSDPIRDAFEEGCLAYELHLDYEWVHPQSGAGASGILRMAGDEHIYEACVEGQHARVYAKSTGKTLGFRDARSLTEIKNFEPGETYRAAVVLRHDDPKFLEGLKDAECWMEWPLAKEVAARCYGTKQAAYSASSDGKFRDVKLRPGETRACFVTPPAYSDLPKDLDPGDALVGSATFARGPSLAQGASRRRAYPLWYYAPPRPAKQSKPASIAANFAVSHQKKHTNASTSDDDHRDASSAPTTMFAGGANATDATDPLDLDADDSEEDAMSDDEAVLLIQELVGEEAAATAPGLKALAAVVFDKQLAYLRDEAVALKLDAAAFEAACAKLERARPEQSLQVRRVRLRRACAEASPKWRDRGAESNASSPVEPANATSVVVAAKAVLDAVDTAAVAQFLATRAPDPALAGPEASKDAVKERAKADAQHKALIEALRWTAEAKLALCLDSTDPALRNDFAAALADLDAWLDTKKAGRLHAQHHRLQSRPGLAVAALSTWLNAKGKKHPEDVKDARTLKADLFDDLGFTAWAQAERKRLLDDIPPKGLTP